MDRMVGMKTKRRGRKIHLPDGAVWQYRLHESCLVLWDPADNKTIVPMNEFTGMPWGDIERAHYKKWWPELGPRAVKDWLLTKSPACVPWEKTYS